MIAFDVDVDADDDDRRKGITTSMESCVLIPSFPSLASVRPSTVNTKIHPASRPLPNLPTLNFRNNPTRRVQSQLDGTKLVLASKSSHQNRIMMVRSPIQNLTTALRVLFVHTSNPPNPQSRREKRTAQIIPPDLLKHQMPSPPLSPSLPQLLGVPGCPAL